MSTILDEILAHKREEVAQRKLRTSRDMLEERAASAPAARGFVSALRGSISQSGFAVIAEVKKASPSKGVIRADFDPPEIALSYAAAGASCLSVLTDEKYFQGSDAYLRDIRQVVDLPLLRKEFIVDDYQLYEARAMGADCVLLIASALDIATLTAFHECAQNLGLDVLVEVHDASELQAALSLSPTLVGINNRNLKTFETSLDTTFALLEHIPHNVLVVTESGIHTRADVQAMLAGNVRAFLVGEAFMRADDPGQALRELFEPSQGNSG